MGDYTQVTADPNAQLYSFEQNVAQPVSEQVQPVNNPANFNGAALANTPQAGYVAPNVAPAKVAADISQEATGNKISSIVTGRDIGNDADNASCNLKGNYPASGIVADVSAAVDNLKNDMAEGLQPPPLANKNEVPVVGDTAVTQDAEQKSVLDTSLTPKEMQFSEPILSAPGCSI